MSNPPHSVLMRAISSGVSPAIIPFNTNGLPGRQVTRKIFSAEIACNVCVPSAGRVLIFRQLCGERGGRLSQNRRCMGAPLGVPTVVPYWIFRPGTASYRQAVRTSCQPHRDLRSAYDEAVETLRSALLVLVGAAGFPNEPEVCAAAQEQAMAAWTAARANGSTRGPGGGDRSAGRERHLVVDVREGEAAIQAVEAADRFEAEGFRQQPMAVRLTTEDFDARFGLRD